MSGLGIRAGSLTAAYGKAIAVSDATIEIAPGECVACVGANGAGKSTLLRVLAGLHRPVAGAVELGGEDVTRQSCDARARRGLALVPEGRRILPFTVAENLLAGQFVGNPEPEALEEVLNWFPVLRARWRADARSLSGGEQQMLALARAMVGRPRVVMLDEPSLGLAPVIIDTLAEHIARIVESGTTCLIVEQNVKLAMRLATRLYIMRRGRIVHEDSSSDLTVEEIVRIGYVH